jgi:glutamyl-tRNA synthetase
VDLAWLGIAPDLVARQSERFAVYAAAAEKLKALGRLYPCYETADELDRRRKRQIARGAPPIYDRAALSLTAEEHAAFAAQGRRPHWRFKLEPRIVTWDDMVRGASHIDTASLSDPVLIREDGTWLYTLPSVVDDIDLGVTHVIRGEDHVTNTAVQIELFEALAGAGAAPVFGHHNLLTTASGEGLSKRSGALSLGALRDAGVEALAVAALAVLTGSSASVRPVQSLGELAGLFDLAHTSRQAARFDERELHALSARTLHGMDYESARARLEPRDIVGHKAEPFWLATRGNLARFAEVDDWWRVVEGDVPVVHEDAAFLAAARASLPEEPWDTKTFAAWTARLKEATGRKGKELFHPLRLALTGRENGPEMAALLPLIGRAKVLARLP